MTHIKTFILIIFSMILTSVNASAKSVETILNTAAEKLTKSKSISADFSINSGNESTTGNIIMAGKKFKLTSDQISTWYDGKTQWSYTTELEEVNISEPTAEELRQINPFAIISDYKKFYNCKILTTTNSSYTVELTAKSQNATITKVVITLNSSTYYPSKIIVTFDNNSVATINVNNIKAGGNVPKSTFVFNSSDYPDAEIIDLR